MLHRSKNSGREFAGWNQLPRRPILTPNISCTKLKIHSAHADSPIVPEHLLSLVPANLHVGPVYVSQIKKLRKRICRMEPAPLWASSYTQYLLYKAQDPSSALDSTIVPKLFLFYIILYWKFGCRTILCFTDQETQKRICRMEPAPLWASSYTQYLLYKIKIHSAYADSPIVPKLFWFCIILCWKFGCWTILCFTDQETQEGNLQDGTSSLVGQFLHPISLVQSSRSIQRMQIVQSFLNTF